MRLAYVAWRAAFDPLRAPSRSAPDLPRPQVRIGRKEHGGVGELVIDVQRGRAVSVPSGTEVEIPHASNLGGAIWARSDHSPGRDGATFLY
jgi:hypothetical protein